MRRERRRSTTETGKANALGRGRTLSSSRGDSSGGGREEVREALHALGFKFIRDKEVDKIFERGDVDGNEVIDFEEFVKETPKTLRSSLIKLAKQNGHDLGFLA